jgi:D-lactate dehydrogenase (cytochrome)
LPVISVVALPEVACPEIIRDPAILEGYLEDASGAPPGRAAGLVRLESEEQASSFFRRTLQSGEKILFQAARTSLTGGAVPDDELVVSVEKMGRVGPMDGERLRVQPGVRLEELQEHLAPLGYFYPPAPTYQQAMLGGTVSTNAGGAATFRYGVTRDWVRGLRVLLVNGDLLVLERGEELARPGEEFEIELSNGEHVRVPVPEYRLPHLKKVSAGYYASNPLDLIDLFIGSEGTLGLITEITVGVAPLPAAVVSALAFLPSLEAACRLSAELREGIRGLRSIEFMDRNCLDLLRDSGAGRRLRIDIPGDAETALLFETEFDLPMTDDQAQQAIADLMDGAGGGGVLATLIEMLDRHGAMEGLQIAFPEDDERRKALAGFREAVPLRVSELLRESPGSMKIGGDLIVPFDRVIEMFEIYSRGFEERGLPYAVWGHISDGNLHPNALPRNAEEVDRGYEAMLEFAEEAALRGGCPLSEHGVGRSRIKQEALRRFLGEEAIAQMRAIKRALDPAGRLAPGVLFPATLRPA